jgi:CheY-like chemotaxis protein
MSTPVVLLVEDDPDIRLSVRMLLEDEGVRAVEAANGRVALDLLTKGLSPQLIILDLIMPTMDGVELLRILKIYNRLATIPVLVLSAYDPSDHPSSARKFDHYLPKPVEQNDLINYIRRLLHTQPQLA